ncbi:MAG: hypothetical protein WBA77_04720 [Microcoleaceae cyanobacterium]
MRNCIEEGVRSHARQYPGAIPAGYEFPPLIEDHHIYAIDGGAKTPDNSSDKVISKKMMLIKLFNSSFWPQ